MGRHRLLQSGIGWQIMLVFEKKPKFEISKFNLCKNNYENLLLIMRILPTQFPRSTEEQEAFHKNHIDIITLIKPVTQ